MANTRSAAKRSRQTETRTVRNQSVVSSIKTQTKKLRTQIAAADKQGAATQYAALTSALDKAAKRGIIHSNAADRRKSRFAKALAGLNAGA